MNVVEWPPENGTIAADRSVFDGEQAFRIFGCHTEKGGNFHPEKGARAARADCRCDAHDVARADGRRQCGAQCFKTGNIAFAVVFIPNGIAQRIFEIDDLQTSQANRQQKPDKKNDDNQGNAPDNAVYRIQNLVDAFHKNFLWL